jgi:hypothetical protein
MKELIEMIKTYWLGFLLFQIPFIILSKITKEEKQIEGFKLHKQKINKL